MRACEIALFYSAISTGVAVVVFLLSVSLALNSTISSAFSVFFLGLLSLWQLFREYFRIWQVVVINHFEYITIFSIEEQWQESEIERTIS